MQIKDEKVKLIAIELKSGFGKQSGKPYRFYTVTVADDQYNRLQFGFARTVSDTIIESLIPLADAHADVVIDFEITPKAGYDIAAQITDMREA